MDRQKVILRFMDGKLVRDCTGELSRLDDFISLEDRRLHQRFTTDLMDMHGKAAYVKVARILDVSLSGILLKTDSKPDVGMTCILKIEWKGRVLNIKSVVAWCLLDKCMNIFGNSIPIYKVGLKFIDSPKEKMEKVVGFIEYHKQKIDNPVDICAATGLRQHMRVQIETPQKALLICRKDYKIRNLSLDGMLIESQDSLDIGDNLSMEIMRSHYKSIKALGKVVSSSLIKECDHTHCGIGIEFLDMMEKDREMLKEFLCLLENMGFVAV